MNPYAELGVPRDADLATIREAFTSLTRALHAEPQGSDVVARIARVNVAFQLLTSPRPTADGPLGFAPQVTALDADAPRPWTARSLTHHGDVADPEPALWDTPAADTPPPA